MEIKGLDAEAYDDSVFKYNSSTWTDWHSRRTIVFDSINSTTFIDETGNPKSFRSLWNEWEAYSMAPDTFAKELNVTLEEGGAVFEAIRNRINGKIEDAYFAHEIGTLPPGRFARYLRQTIEQEASKLGEIYIKLAKGLDIFNEATTKRQMISANSQFPQAAITPSQRDYATESDELSENVIITGKELDKLLKFSEEFTEPDSQIVRAVSCCFSALI